MSRSNQLMPESEKDVEVRVVDSGFGEFIEV